MFENLMSLAMVVLFLLNAGVAAAFCTVVLGYITANGGPRWPTPGSWVYMIVSAFLLATIVCKTDEWSTALRVSVSTFIATLGITMIQLIHQKTKKLNTDT